MKKHLLFLLVCFSLIMPGSSLITGLNAQTKGKRTARTPINQKRSQKTPSELKNPSLQKIARQRKDGNLAAGDPCLMTLPITLGQTLNGSLAATDCTLDDGTFIDFYSFNGTAGQPISVSQNSGLFDTFLILFDDAGEVIDLNDDSGDGTNSRIPADAGALILPYTGAYVIGANSFAAAATGAYTVSLNTDTACTATTITYNQTVNGALAESDCAVSGLFFTDLYKFNGVAGQQISIAQNSTAIDSYLILHTPSGAGGNIEDDDSGGAPNARIPETGLFTLPETGTYTIEASSFDLFEVGAYTLTLTGPTVAPPSDTPFDFDGDGKTDISIFRPSAGEWWYSRSSDGQIPATQFGASGDKLVPADFTGDGKTDIAVFRPSTGEWFVLRSEDGSFFSFPFGSTGDIPVVGDFDADGKADAGVFRSSNSTWFIQKSTGGTIITTFGQAGDAPVVADYDGDGKSDIAIFRANGVAGAEWWYSRSSDSQIGVTTFGTSTDKAVPGDYTGDGKADIAFFRPSTGEWFILRSEDSSFFSFPFGAAGDTPAPGDYDGDGKTDPTVFRASSSTWFVNRTTAGILITTFGTSGDQPVPNVFVP